MKVLHVLNSRIYSGAENVVFTIIKYLQERYEFVYIATDGPIRERLEQEGIPYVLLETFSRRNLAKAIRAFRPDIVHAHDFSATVLCAVLPGRFRLISHLHYDPPWSRRWNGKTLLYRLCNRRIDAVLAVSRRSFDTMVFADFYQDKLQVIRNPIDGAKIRSLADQMLEIGAEDRNCDLIFVGRLVEQKNPQRFIRLVKEVKQSVWPEIRAKMLGQGNLWEECKSLIQRENLNDTIEMLGFQKNPYPYIKDAGILCITSRWEGYGLVAAEANILGVPVLSTRNSGCQEIYGDAGCELCAEDSEFIEKIKLLHNDPTMYAEWKERSLVQGEAFDNIGVYMERLSFLYDLQK